MRNNYSLALRSISIAALALLCVAGPGGCSQSPSPSGQQGSGGRGSGGVTASGGSISAGGGATGSGGEMTGSGGAGIGGTTGAGGSVGTGGITGAGGAVATGGTVLTGGTSATAGRSGSGGIASTGGIGPTGGAKATGGSSSAGGSTGSDGGPGTGGSATGGTGTAGTSAGGSGGSAGDGGAANGAVPSVGCGKTPTLKDSPTATANQNTLTISGTSRQFVMRRPSNYDNTHPYRLILDFHGAGGKDTDLAPSYFGLFDLSNNTTIFVAPSANGGIWDATADSSFVDEILNTVEADLCVDKSRVELEGFSQGGAMVAVLACGRPGVFRAAVGHSRGGLTAPTTCQPIPYLGSLGLSDISGNSQATQTDAFAKWDGCTITTMPLAPTGGHLCTSYTGCPAADPVIWCSFDGPHTASPTDAGKSSSWMPAEVWPFLSQF